MWRHDGYVSCHAGALKLFVKGQGTWWSMMVIDNSICGEPSNELLSTRICPNIGTRFIVPGGCYLIGVSQT